jgi:dephospho-CoA kinase
VDRLGLNGSAATGMRRIGLTGGIGSGKSTVARAFVALGATLVDTDAIARALTAPGGAALPALQVEFGHDIVGADGALNRDRMRALAFGDAASKQRLESVLHPMIGAQARAEAEAAGPQAVVLFDVPLLAESSHWRARCDRIVVVDCDVATQVARVMQRSGWPEAQVKAVIAQQASRERRRAIADAVIHNDSITEAQLAAQVRALWSIWVDAGAHASGHTPSH